MAVMNDILQDPAKQNPLTESELTNKFANDYDAVVSQQAGTGVGTQQNTDVLPESMGLADMYDKLNTHRPETKEQTDAREKREKRNMLLGKIGDAFSAFHTAYSKARGVQPMVNPGESLSGKLRERYDRLNKEREALDKEYNLGKMRAMQQDAQYKIDRAKINQAAEARQEANRLRAEETARKAEADKAKAKAVADKQNAEYQRRMAIANGDRKQEAYWKAIADGYTPEQATSLANATPKVKPTKRSGSGGYSRRNNQDWTTTVTDKNGQIKQVTTRKYGTADNNNTNKGKVKINY